MIDIATVTICLYDSKKNLISADQGMVNIDSTDQDAFNNMLTKIFEESGGKYLKDALTSGDADAIETVANGLTVGVFVDKEPIGSVTFKMALEYSETCDIDYPFDY